MTDSITSFKQLIGDPLTPGSVSGPVRGETRRRRRRRRRREDDDEDNDDYDNVIDDDDKNID